MPLPYRLREIERARSIREFRRANRRTDWLFWTVCGVAGILCIVLPLAAIFLQIIPHP